ncbi:gastrula zinc finger protein XlCGF7.1-like [Syngnathus typhle]|uniref:gastrula zinc finger protein XlCGF7.1-like n=1 Tax=Syngnathus typhle TaxID=161592 RepID=UPI002A6AD825|nr:gastrula zinc finger protein XlCGF7.1-like [Syngnathus typhle]XP_061153804.1 gastrula zinc finger protein XlCGF7.1-like [Syngnathus typhle]XP_061153805.1 gastrula zinc finger protein XlCGF7.1-like [Syngnathus typhle]
MTSQGGPELLSIKEEDVWTSHDGEHAISSFPSTIVHVKSEDDNEAQASQLHHTPSEEKTSNGGLHGEEGISQLDNVAPSSDTDEVTSHSSDYITDDSDDGKRSPEVIRKAKKHNSCSECGKAFRSHAILNRHMKRHTGEKPYACSACGKAFSRRDSLVSHMRSHTKEKTFTCSVCTKTFRHRQNLSTHRRSHNGKKRFSCSQCGRAFSAKANLMRHALVHTGEKRFFCSVCNKRFTTKRNMMGHMRSHTSEKPFSCSV